MLYFDMKCHLILMKQIRRLVLIGIVVMIKTKSLMN